MAKKKKVIAKVIPWRISVIRKKGEYIGTVLAPEGDAAGAIKIAIEELGITDPDRRKRLAAQPEQCQPRKRS